MTPIRFWTIAALLAAMVTAAEIDPDHRIPDKDRSNNVATAH